MCLEVKREFIKKWAKNMMPDYKTELAEMGYILFKKENSDFSIKTDIRVQFHGTLLSFGGFSVVFKTFETVFSNFLGELIEKSLFEKYYGQGLVLVINDFYHSDYVFPESVKDETELEIYLSEFLKCVRFYEEEIFPKLTDIHFLAEYVGSVPFEKQLEIVVGGQYPVTIFKKLAILKWGDQEERYNKYKEGLSEFIEDDFEDPKYAHEAPLYKQGFKKLIYHLENQPNPFA